MTAFLLLMNLGCVAMNLALGQPEFCWINLAAMAVIVGLAASERHY